MFDGKEDLDVKNIKDASFRLRQWHSCPEPCLFFGMPPLKYLSSLQCLGPTGASSVVCAETGPLWTFIPVYPLQGTF